MPHIISIPEPCHEDWNKMTPNEQGRHCIKCEKTVIDFREWQPEEIIFYMQANKNVCGRFFKDQLDVPLPSPEDFVVHIVHSPLSFIKKIAAIFLFVFGLMATTSCNRTQPLSAIRAMPVHLNEVKIPERLPEPPMVSMSEPTIVVENFRPEVGGDVVAMPEPPVMGGAPIAIPVIIDSASLIKKPLPPPDDSL